MGPLAVRCAMVTWIALASASCAAGAPAPEAPTVLVGAKPKAPAFPTPGERLCALLTEDNPQLERAAMSLASLDDGDARAAGGRKLAALAAVIAAPAWREAARARLGAEADPAIAEARAEAQQTEALAPILAAMSHLGGPAVEKQARAIAADASAPRARRELAERVLDRLLGRVPASAPRSPVGEGRGNVAQLRAALRRCYQAALQRNPDVHGRVQLRVMRGPGGRRVVVVEGDALPADMVRCIEDAAAAWMTVDEGSATSAPLNFVFHPG